MEKFLYPTHWVLCIIPGHSECGETYFPTNLNLNNVNEFEKNIYSPFLYEDLYQKLNKSFSNSLPIDIVWNNLIEEDKDLVI